MRGSRSRILAARVMASRHPRIRFRPSNRHHLRRRCRTSIRLPRVWRGTSGSPRRARRCPRESTLRQCRADPDHRRPSSTRCRPRRDHTHVSPRRRCSPIQDRREVEQETTPVGRPTSPSNRSCDRWTHHKRGCRRPRSPTSESRSSLGEGTRRCLAEALPTNPLPSSSHARRLRPHR